MIIDAGTTYTHEPIVLQDGDYLVGQGKDVTVICFVPTPATLKLSQSAPAIAKKPPK